MARTPCAARPLTPCAARPLTPCAARPLTPCAALALALCAALAGARTARADALTHDARTLARAGGSVVSADGGAALDVNPAGLARRSVRRIALGATLADERARFRATGFGAFDAAETRDRAPTRTSLAGHFISGIGTRVVAGLAYSGPGSVRFDAPAPVGATAPVATGCDDRCAAPHRYGGTRLDLSRHALAAGLAVRLTPWLAAGAAGEVAHVGLAATRMVWGGRTVGNTPGELDPAFDALLEFDTTAALVPGATVGLIAAPRGLPIELGLALTAESEARLAGTARLHDGRGRLDGSAGVTALSAPDARAELTLPGELTVRAGVRLLAARAAAELSAEFTHREGQPVASLAGLSLRHDDGATAEVTQAPLGPTLIDAHALRIAADVDLIPGFLTLTVAWAFRSAGLVASSASPAWTGDGGHVLAAGVEARAGDVTVVVGIARTLDAEFSLAPGDARVLAPFVAGPPALPGTIATDALRIGISVELALPD